MTSEIESRRHEVDPEDVRERREKALADLRWTEAWHQACDDCHRPQRFDYRTCDAQWARVVGKRIWICVECYLRLCEVAGESGAIFISGSFRGRTSRGFLGKHPRPSTVKGWSLPRSPAPACGSERCGETMRPQAVFDNDEVSLTWGCGCGNTCDHPTIPFPFDRPAYPTEFEALGFEVVRA